VLFIKRNNNNQIKNKLIFVPLTYHFSSFYLFPINLVLFPSHDLIASSLSLDLLASLALALHTSIIICTKKEMKKTLESEFVKDGSRAGIF